MLDTKITMGRGGAVNKGYLFNVYFPKVYFLKEYSPKVYFSILFLIWANCTQDVILWGKGKDMFSDYDTPWQNKWSGHFL